MLNFSNSSFADITRALECFVLRHQRQDASSLSELKASFERATPGQRALLWLVKSGAVSDLAYLSHPTFLKAVAHCLVAEGGSKYLFQWIMVKDNPLAPVDVKIGRDNSFWRGRLLLYAMESQAYWTENAMLLEDSVNTWLSMVRQASAQQTYISPAMSAKWAAKLLTTRSLGGPFLASAKFEEFVRAHGKHGSWSAWEENMVMFQAGRLMMHHPEKRDATIMLDILRRHYDMTNETIYGLLAPTDPKGNRLMFLTIVELAQLLAHQGSLRDARWALDFGRHHIPDFFQMRKVAQHAIGGDLSMRKARRAEIAEGLADEQGYLKQADRNLMPSSRPVMGWRR